VYFVRPTVKVVGDNFFVRFRCAASQGRCTRLRKGSTGIAFAPSALNECLFRAAFFKNSVQYLAERNHSILHRYHLCLPSKDSVKRHVATFSTSSLLGHLHLKSNTQILKRTA
jgi:hypothetical protein